MAETTTMDKGKDDNLMAAIAHVGIFAVVLPLVIWLMQKEKSKYVAFQAMQAAVYQLVAIVGLVILWIIGMVVVMVLGAVTGGLGGLLMFPMMLVFFVLGLGAFLYGLYGAYMCYQGKDFKYAVVGNMLAKR
jgi:uncharacterized Tic20 family protein